MKAVVYNRYGSPDVLQVKTVEKPTPGIDEVLIKVHAAEVTKADCEMRSFNFPVKWFWLPLRFALGVRRPRRQILGGYFAGEVATVGKNVSEFKPGDPIFGSTKLRLGAYGEYLCLPASYTIAQKPHNMSFEAAAAVPLGGLNAIHFLRKAKIKRDERILVNGAGGSIGTFGVQMAKAMGAHVTAVDSGIKEEMLRQIGADDFVDYARADFTNNNQSYDVIFNMVAKTSFSACIKALTPRGRYLMANPRVSDMLNAILTSRRTDKTVYFAFARETREELLDLKKMIEAGKIKSIVDKIYPLDETADAHRWVETEQRLGSVVLSHNHTTQT